MAASLYITATANPAYGGVWAGHSAAHRNAERCATTARQRCGDVHDVGGIVVAYRKLSNRRDAEWSGERELHAGDEPGIGSAADFAGSKRDGRAASDASFVCRAAAVVERGRRIYDAGNPDGHGHAFWITERWSPPRRW